jgi:hypothetical protein
VDEAKDEPKRTPFERMTGLARKIVSVPKSELPRKPKKKRKRHVDSSVRG